MWKIIKNLYFHFELLSIIINWEDEFIGFYFCSFLNYDNDDSRSLFGIGIKFNAFIEKPKHDITYLELFWISII